MHVDDSVFPCADKPWRKNPHPSHAGDVIRFAEGENCFVDFAIVRFPIFLFQSRNDAVGEPRRLCFLDASAIGAIGNKPEALRRERTILHTVNHRLERGAAGGGEDDEFHTAEITVWWSRGELNPDRRLAKPRCLLAQPRRDGRWTLVHLSS